MKLFIGHSVGFALMFMFMFVSTSMIFLFYPLLMAFIAWDTSFITLDWETVFAFIRINILISVFMGLGFTFSKEGKALAKGE